MSLFDYLFGKKEPKSELTIGCVASQIIQDLNSIGYDDWIHSSKSSSSGKYYDIFRHPLGKYTLEAYLPAWLSPNARFVTISELHHSCFNKREHDAIYQALYDMNDRHYKMLTEKEKQKDLEFLKKTFPTCYPKQTLPKNHSWRRM
jgi:hypothetical protein